MQIDQIKLLLALKAIYADAIKRNRTGAFERRVKQLCRECLGAKECEIIRAEVKHERAAK